MPARDSVGIRPAIALGTREWNPRERFRQPGMDCSCQFFAPEFFDNVTQPLSGRNLSLQIKQLPEFGHMDKERIQSPDPVQRPQNAIMLEAQSGKRSISRVDGRETSP